jgi:hypothetical protein
VAISDQPSVPDRQSFNETAATASLFATPAQKPATHIISPASSMACLPKIQLKATIRALFDLFQLLAAMTGIRPG